MTDAIARARELLAFAKEDGPLLIGVPPVPPYTLISKDALADVCTALLAADERVRQAVEAEREACAQICADWATHALSKQDGRLPDVDTNLRMFALGPNECANLIRARGQPKGEE